MTKKGFTLIEILVVVTIIGILASITLLGLGPARRSAQDARRVADLRAVQAANEVYFSKNGAYPIATLSANRADFQNNYGFSTAGVLRSALNNANITDTIPNEPTANTARRYGYITDASGSQYTMIALLDGSPGGYVAPGNPVGGAAISTAYTVACGQTQTVANGGFYVYCIVNP